MRINFYFAMITLGGTKINPSLPGPLSFFSQNGGLHSLLRLGEGPATKERS